MHHHQSLGDGVDGQRDDHRGNAQIGDADAVEKSQRDAAKQTERNRQRLADRPVGRGRGRHHAAHRHHPGYREVDLAEQDHDHHAGGDDAEKRGHLELLEQVGRRQEAGIVQIAEQQQHDDAGIGGRHRWIDAAQHPGQTRGGGVCLGRAHFRIIRTGRVGCAPAPVGPRRCRPTQATRCPGTAIAIAPRC